MSDGLMDFIRVCIQTPLLLHYKIHTTLPAIPDSVSILYSDGRYRPLSGSKVGKTAHLQALNWD
jgi:hypothetical protein